MISYILCYQLSWFSGTRKKRNKEYDNIFIKNRKIKNIQYFL